jgi:tight adherence protein C
VVAINIIFLFLFLILWIKTKRYDIESIQELDDKVHPLKKMYPLGLYLCDKTPLKGLLDKIIYIDDSLKALHVGEPLNQVKRIYICKKVVLTVVILLLTNLFALGYAIKEENIIFNGSYIKRPGENEGSKSITLDVLVSEDNGPILEEEITLEVKEAEYDTQELERKFAYGKQYIDKKVLGNNVNADEIRTNLNFVTGIPETKIRVSWETNNIKLIDKDGTVYNKSLLNSELVEVTATLSYKDTKELYTMFFKVFPKEYTKEELVRIRLQEILREEDINSKKETVFKLPNSIDEQKVTWAEKEDHTTAILFIFGTLAGVLIFIIMDQNLISLVDKRNKEMLMDYPEIINKFTLLVGAGMSLSNAWIKIAKDYKEKIAKKRFAYEEINITASELMLGTSEVIAYERFGRRVKLLPYLRFSSLIAQNVKKGSGELLNQLELEAAEAFEERKELAKRLGEEAATKLLIPMVLMLLIVLSIIMVPVMLSFGL